MSQNSTHQTKSSTACTRSTAAVSAGPSAGDLTKERVTLESALHTEAAGLSHPPGPRQHSAGGASYVGAWWRRDTQDAISLSHMRASVGRRALGLNASGHMSRCAADDDRVKRVSVNPSSPSPLFH